MAYLSPYRPLRYILGKEVITSVSLNPPLSSIIPDWDAKGQSHEFVFSFFLCKCFPLITVRTNIKFYKKQRRFILVTCLVAVAKHLPHKQREERFVLAETSTYVPGRVSQHQNCVQEAGLQLMANWEQRAGKGLVAKYNFPRISSEPTSTK